MTRRRVGARWMLVFAATLPLNALALSSSALQDMFVSTTSPSVYQSQTRMGLVGGQFSMRVPNQSINLMTFDPPRFDAGCGGLDMFGGSFSFINTEQIVKIFRNIGQIAVAALFKLAISAISKELSSVMTEFRTAMEALNNVKLNSCKIGNAIALDVEDVAKGAEREAGTHVRAELAAATGRTAESWSHFWNSLFKSDSKDLTRDRENPTVSNLTWRAVNNSMSYSGVRGLSGREVATLIINITGTKILPTADTPTDGPCPEAFTTDPEYPATPIARCTRHDFRILPGNLTIEKLMDPENTAGGDEKQLWRCADGADISDEFGCQKMNLGPVTTAGGFPGAKKLAWKVLFGAEGQAAQINPTGGIVYFIETGEWGTFPDAQNFIGSISVPVLRQLVTVQRDPQAVRQVAGYFADVLANDIAVAFAEALADAAAMTFSGHHKVSAPMDVDQKIDAFRKSISKYRATTDESKGRQTALAIYVGEMAKSLGAGAVPPAGKR